MEMYYYKIYGIYVCCNIKIELLNEICGIETYNLFLNVVYGYQTHSDIIKMKKNLDDTYTLNLGKHAKYKIDYNNNKIECIAINYEAFFSTLFNIPFSIYFFSKKEKLIHACSMLRGNSLYCFSGKKGTGKSTLTQLLDGMEFKLYSDDTIRETNDGNGIRATNLIKLTNETIQNLKIVDVLDYKNIMGKSYKKIHFDVEPTPIKTIIQLYRTESTLTLEKITDKKMIRLLYTENIVGSNYFTREILNDLFNVSLPQNILFYKMAIPNELLKLKREKNKIEELLTKI